MFDFCSDASGMWRDRTRVPSTQGPRKSWTVSARTTSEPSPINTAARVGTSSWTTRPVSASASAKPSASTTTTKVESSHRTACCGKCHRALSRGVDSCCRLRKRRRSSLTTPATQIDHAAGSLKAYRLPAFGQRHIHTRGHGT